jgi:hypothetical protein
VIYTNDKSSKLIEQYEAMKTPESRMGAMQQKNEDLTKQLDDMKKMIKLAIEQLDKTLEVFKGSYKLTRPAAVSESAKRDEIFYKYVNEFKTDKIKQKAEEGYFSKVDYKAIQVEFACYVNGGDGTSCKVAEKECKKGPLPANHDPKNFGNLACTEEDAKENKNFPWASTSLDGKVEQGFLTCSCTDKKGRT